METKKKQLKGEYLSLSDKARTKLTLSTMALGFFLIGFILDCINYLDNKSWLLLMTNMPIVIFMSFTIIYQIIKVKTYQSFNIISFILVTLNVIYAYIDTIIFDSDIDFGIARLVIFSLVVILYGGLLLGSYWVHFFTTVFALCYIGCSWYAHTDNLMENMVMLPAILIFSGVWVKMHVTLYRRNSEAALKNKEESIRLQNIIYSDRHKVNRAIEDFYERNKDNSDDLRGEIKTLAKIANYNLPNVVSKHAEKISSDENLFINKLLKTHPTLTAGDLKLSYMLVINMTTKEIAESTMRTPDSVRVTRTRLRKKLNLERGDNLGSYLKQFD